MKIKISLLLAILVGVLVITASANDNISVLANGQKCAFDQPPVIINNRTMVPCRSIFEKLGAKVNWDPASKEITVENGTDTVQLKINDDVMKVNDTNVKLDCAPQILNGRTLVPVRAISEALDCNVSWNNKSKTVAINNKPTSNCPTNKILNNNCPTGNRNVSNLLTNNCPAGNSNVNNCPTGNCNTGKCTTGNCATNNCTTGNCNVSNCPTSNCPTGNCNTANSPISKLTSGGCPTGNSNAGNCPTGNANTNRLTKLQCK